VSAVLPTLPPDRRPAHDCTVGAGELMVRVAQGCARTASPSVRGPLPRAPLCPARRPPPPQVVPAFWWHMTLNLEDAVILKREPATLQRDLGLAPAAGGMGARAEL
jgi:hypothetical protein